VAAKVDIALLTGNAFSERHARRFVELSGLDPNLVEQVSRRPLAQRRGTNGVIHKSTDRRRTSKRN
jgi:hypothetical protein